jgi:hypothetical protein
MSDPILTHPVARRRRALAFAVFAALAAAPASAANLLVNPGFEAVGPQGAFTSFTCTANVCCGGQSAADSWTTWINQCPQFGFPENTIRTAHVTPSTAPAGGNAMIHVLATSAESGIVQVFGPFNTGPAQVTSSVWVYVVSGQVCLGTGNGGNTHCDDHSTTTGQWELLQAPNGVSPANELIVYASSAGGAEFYADNAESEEEVALDHFKCYTVRPRTTFTPLKVTLKDQFEAQDVTVLRPVSLCNPVTKCHDGVCTEPVHPEEHLTCYRTQDVEGTPGFQRRRVLVSNQFGTQELTVVRRNDLLCLPSAKKLLER